MFTKMEFFLLLRRYDSAQIWRSNRTSSLYTKWTRASLWGNPPSMSHRRWKRTFCRSCRRRLLHRHERSPFAFSPSRSFHYSILMWTIMYMRSVGVRPLIHLPIRPARPPSVGMCVDTTAYGEEVAAQPAVATSVRTQSNCRFYGTSLLLPRRRKHCCCSWGKVPTYVSTAFFVR